MPDSSLWTLYERLRNDGAPLSMRKVSERGEIFPVFQDLFKRRSQQEKGSLDGCLPANACSRAPTGISRSCSEIHDACEEIARKELGLDVYPNQIEVITAEQMLDAYSSVGMPLFYKHWSFGKQFAFQEASYRKGLDGASPMRS